MGNGAVDLGNDARERIIRSAHDLFFTRGYRNTTVDDIVRNTGISKRTIYENFSNKEKIAEVVVDGVLDTLFARMQEIVVSKRGPFEKFGDLYFSSLEMLNPDISAVFLDDLERYLPELWDRVEGIRKEVLYELRQVFDEGKSQGIFLPDMDSEVTVATLIGAIQTTMSSDFLFETGLSLKQVFSKVFELISHGILREDRKAE